MRFTVSASDFLAIVTAASLPTPRRNTLPVLGHLHLRATETTIRAIGSDLDTWSAATCGAAVSEPGDICAPAEGLKAALSRMKGDVTVEMKGPVLRLAAGRMSAELPTLDGTDFPLVAPKGEVTEIVGGVEAIRTCAPFASTEETRFYLCGVCMDGETAVATDGHAMTTATISGGNRQIIPNAAIPAILKTGGRLFVGDTLWKCEAEGRVLTGKLVDGSFPDWRRIIPQAQPWITVNAQELADAIDAATLGTASRVLIDTTSGEIIVTGEGFTEAARSAEIDAPGEVHASAAQTFAREIILRALTRHKGEITLQAGASPMALIETEDGKTVAMGQNSHRNVLIGDREAA